MKSRFLKDPNIGVAICTAIALSLCSSARANILCFGILDSDPGVCSGHGKCVATDTCECEAGYIGDECQLVACFGMPVDDPGICSEHGTCIGPDTCICDAGYAGDECGFPTCFGLPGFDPSVCSGHGTCIAPDTCECQVGFLGDECESMALPTVTVGNPGNADDAHDDGYGGVDYVYKIGKFEVTAGQYTEFLNAVAADDTYELYNPYMDLVAHPDDRGCNIVRTGSSGSYTYSVAADWADRPVNWVSWGDAARFANWLHNGQPTGAQDLSTTEDGSYYLNGATTDGELIAVVREPDATWVIPSEDEWYKVAYHCNDGVTGNYFDYPTSTDSVPSNDLVDPDPGNNANFWDGGCMIGSPYYRTVVGDFENSESPYDTFDQGGNVWEWNEAVPWDTYRGLRGGSFVYNDYHLHAASPFSDGYHPTYEDYDIGFRVARVPKRGDYDANGTVDLADYAELPACLTGPGAGLEPQCHVFDFDFDVDVDLADFAGFQRVCMSPSGMVFVPGGEFEMGDPFNEGDVGELPVHTVYLSPYYIDTYEVPNQQYVNGLNWAWSQGGLIAVTSGVVYQAGSGTNYPYCDTYGADDESRIHWDGATFTVTPGKENHPMVEVSWYGAVAYCNWRSAMEGKPLCYDLSTWACNFGVAGYRLPTEAEWEKAAGWDPVQQRHFRFGEHTDGCGYNCLDGHRANYVNSGDPFDTGDFPWTTPVGYYDGTTHGSYTTQDAKSYYGCYDMSGNVWEWCYDWHDYDYYDSSPYSNPHGPATGTYPVLRGGVWLTNPHVSRSALRAKTLPDGRYYHLGFRRALGTP